MTSKVGGEDDQSQWFGGQPMSARALESWIVASSSRLPVSGGFIFELEWCLPLCRTVEELNGLLAV